MQHKHLQVIFALKIIFKSLEINLNLLQIGQSNLDTTVPKFGCYLQVRWCEVLWNEAGFQNNHILEEWKCESEMQKHSLCFLKAWCKQQMGKL